MRIVMCMVVLFACGCRSLEQSKWESSVNAGTRIYVDRPNAVEAVDLSASLKRAW